MKTTNDAQPLIFALALDGMGGAAPLRREDFPVTGDNAAWLHLDLENGLARRWLARLDDMPPLAAEALFHEESRPRCVAIDDGLLLNLRGVNLNPRADPEDMVSIRIYADHRRIVSVRRRQLATVSDVRAPRSRPGSCDRKGPASRPLRRPAGAHRSGDRRSGGRHRRYRGPASR